MDNAKSLLDFFKKLYTPLPHCTTNHIEDALLLKKNKIAFWFLFIVVITHPFLMFFGKLPWQMNVIIGCWKLFSFTLFILLCRSHIWWFYFCFTLVVSLIPVIFLSRQKEWIFVYPGLCMIMPICVLMLSNNLFLTIMNGIAQVITSHFIFKDVFRDALLTMDLEFVSKKMVHNNLIIMICIILFFSFIVRGMNKNTKDLAYAHKKTEELLDQQKTFIFSFSHELRNPLNSLLGNLQLILMSTISDQTRTMVKTSQICAELLLQLVNNILDIGKCDIGKLEVNQAPTEVHGLFQRIWTVSSQLITNKKLRSHIKIERKVPLTLMLDSHRLNQMMMNLIGNAIKFTDTGSVSVTVQWLAHSSVNDESFEPVPYNDMDEGIFEKEENLYMLSMGSGDYLQQPDKYFMLSQKSYEALRDRAECPEQTCEGILKIIVKDTGSGMDQAALGKLFGKFSQVSNDVHKRQIGTGLGLYITKEICKKMGGDVRAYSKPNSGSTFIICIPTVSVVNSGSSPLERTQTRKISKIHDKKLNAIVADDSPLNVNIISDFFKKISTTVIRTADNGLDAFNKYKESIEAGVVIDIITLDIDMPIMNGKIACEKIRGYERQKGIIPTTIMLISGNYDEGQVKECLDSNSTRRADCFLRKPLLFEEFSSAVYRLKIRG